MKDVVFKLKFNHPNRLSSPKLNSSHFEYICKRPGAVYNHNRSFCCFGKVLELGFSKFGEINEFRKTQEHIF